MNFDTEKEETLEDKLYPTKEFEKYLNELYRCGSSKDELEKIEESYDPEKTEYKRQHGML